MDTETEGCLDIEFLDEDGVGESYRSSVGRLHTKSSDAESQRLTRFKRWMMEGGEGRASWFELNVKGAEEELGKGVKSVCHCGPLLPPSTMC